MFRISRDADEFQININIMSMLITPARNLGCNFFICRSKLHTAVSFYWYFIIYKFQSIVFYTHFCVFNGNISLKINKFILGANFCINRRTIFKPELEKQIFIEARLIRGMDYIASKFNYSS